MISIESLLVGIFFVGNSGTLEQRSQASLLRSLLFEILQHQPKLIRSVFSEECAFLQSQILTDPSDLYHHMLGQVDKFYFTRTSRIFQMVQRMRRIQGERSFDNQRTTQVTFSLLAPAVEERPNMDVNSVSEVRLARILSTLCDVLTRRLQTWCAGLLDVPDFLWSRVDALVADTTVRTKFTWEVAFLHRTARDFIEFEDSVWNNFIRRIPPLIPVYHYSNLLSCYTSLLGSSSVIS